MGKCEYKYRTLVCVSCGKSVNGHFSKNRKYCSRECWDTKRPSRIKRKLDDRNCEWCGNIFHQKSETQKFCSNSCVNVWQGRNKSIFICKTCGASFGLSKSLANSREYEVKFCSISCRNKDPEWRLSNIKANEIQSHKIGLNKLELAGNAIMDELGVEYEYQYLLFDKFLVDVILLDKKLVIQWDGDYWHGHPTKLINGIPDNRQMQRMMLDKSQDSYMTTAGYSVLRFWESDVKLNKSYVYETIKRAIQ